MTEGSRTGRDERRTAILTIARDVFLQNGYAATSMSQISVRVGGSKATLYNYFPSKKDLFFAVAEAESARILAHLFDMSAACSDVRQCLFDLCWRMITTMLDEEMLAFYRMVFAESARFPEVGQIAYSLGFQRGVERTAEMIEAAMKGGLLRPADPLAAARFLHDLSEGYYLKLFLWGIKTSYSPQEIENTAQNAVNQFLAVYGTDEMALAARQSLL